MTAALWLICTAQLVGSGKPVSMEVSSERAVVRSADKEIVAQAAVLGRETQGTGSRARTLLKFEGGELSYHDVYGHVRSPRLKGLAELSHLRCKTPHPAK